MIELFRYNFDHKNTWDNVVTKSKNGLFLFYRNYMDYHKERFLDHSLMISKNNKIIALFPANEQDKQIFSHSGLTFGSLIMSFDLKATEVLEIFNLIIDYYRALGFSTIIYKAIPNIFHQYPSDEDLYALFRIKANLIRRDISSVICMENRLKFSETKRQLATKCEKIKVEFLENDDFTDYWFLLSEVLSKFHTKPVHSVEEITNLKQDFPQQIRLFEARQKGILLAGIVIYDYDNVAHTQYMANSAEGRKVGALDFINHNLINIVFSNKKYYSFGISTENQGQVLNEGLIQQKEMMGSRAIAVDFYQIDLWS